MRRMSAKPTKRFSRTDREVFTAYITKYALTQGIFAVEVELCADIAAGMVSTRSTIPGHGFTFHGQDWHRDLPAAIARAKVMVERKLASLEVRRRKLEDLLSGSWEPVPFPTRDEEVSDDE